MRPAGRKPAHELSGYRNSGYQQGAAQYLWRENISCFTLEIINPGEDIPLTNLVQCESVRLFADRAAATDPFFTVNERNSRAVLRICQLLDGIPLAIELAAARARALTAEGIAERLGDMFQLLYSSSPTLIPRHQNLHVAFDWSFSLLTEPEKALFRRLGVFHGGWTSRSG